MLIAKKNKPRGQMRAMSSSKTTMLDITPIYLVKLSTMGGEGQNYLKFCPHGLYTQPLTLVFRFWTKTLTFRASQKKVWWVRTLALLISFWPFEVLSTDYHAMLCVIGMFEWLYYNNWREMQMCVAWSLFPVHSIFEF